MKKIPTIFKRDVNNMKRILREVNQDCAWVFKGEGIATRKYNGTCCLVKGGILYKRREVKEGRAKPEGFIEVDFDKVTRKVFGWVPVNDGKEDQWHLEAFSRGKKSRFIDGTYELCGPKIQGNSEYLDQHILIAHAHAYKYPDIDRTYDGIKEFLGGMNIEGIVFHHPDGRMAKIKVRDYDMSSL